MKKAGMNENFGRLSDLGIAAKNNGVKTDSADLKTNSYSIGRKSREV